MTNKPVLYTFPGNKFCQILEKLINEKALDIEIISVYDLYCMNQDQNVIKTIFKKVGLETLPILKFDNKYYADFDQIERILNKIDN
jgi:hypothetical protein